jgi:hypothetical protein
MVAGVALAGYTNDALEISKANAAQPKFQKMKGQITFKIFGSDGSMKYQKRMMMAQYVQNQGTANEIENSISAFIEPADDRGNAYMAYRYKNQPDAKFVYLKGIKKAKKVSGATRKSSFFGSDFSNDDMGYPNITEYNFKILGKEKLPFKGKEIECDIIEMTPKNEQLKSDIGYGRKVCYIAKTNDMSFLTIRLDFYDTNMKKTKTQDLVSFVVQKNLKGENVFFTTGLLMKNHGTGTKTELIIENLKFENDANISADIFTEQWLERKWW